MDLYQLRYFLEVARERSFTKAAANLGVSPSAVSRSVALLERSVKRRLFARTKRSVAPTVFGESLRASAERIFDEVERARAGLEGETAAPERLRIASREMITNYLLPGPLASYAKRWPATRFGLFELEPGELAEALKKDQVDLGFHYADLSDPAIESRPLGRLRSHVYGLKGREGAAFVAPRPFGAAPGTPSADGWPDAKRPRDVRYEAEFMETHRRFILEGLCVGVLPDLVVAEERRKGRLVALDSPPIYREIHWFKRRGRTLPRAVDFLVAEVRRTIAELE